MLYQPLSLEIADSSTPNQPAEISYPDGLSLNRSRIADSETGLVFSLTYNFLGGAGFYSGRSSIAVAHVNKVQGNQVLAVEAMGVGQLQLRSANTPAQASINWSAFTR